MNDPINLAKPRADKADDCRLWTPLDALKDLIRQIEDGEVAPDRLIVIHHKGAAGPGDLYVRFAGVDKLQTLALLSIALHEATGDCLR